MYHADLIASLANIFFRLPLYWGLVNFSLDPKTTKFNTRIVARICSYLSFISPNKIISCSQNSSKLHSIFGYNYKKFYNINLGIDIDKNIDNIAIKKKIRRKLDINTNYFVIGCIGRWDPQKNHENLIKSIYLLSQKKTNFICVLAGPNIDNKNKDLVALIDKWKVKDLIRLVGYVDDIDDFYYSIDLKILPSIGEAFPLVLIEAMLRGVVSIATDVGENKNILNDNNLIIKSTNYEDLYNSLIKMCDLFENNQNLWQSKRIKLHKLVKNNYNIKTTTNEYEKIWYNSKS